MNKTTYVLLKSLIVNSVLVLIKLIVGIFGNSRTLIADGIHSFSDLSTDIIAMFGSVISKKPADKRHPFGHGKAEYLTSIIIGSVILVIGINLIINAFSGDIHIPSNIVLYVTIFTIIIKLILALYLLKKGKIYKNNILISSGRESMADVISSIFVIISFIGSKLTNYSEIFRYSDSIGTIIVGLFILYTSYKILKDNITTILGEIEDDNDYINYLKEKILSFPEVMGIENLIVVKYGSYYKVELSIYVQKLTSVSDSNKLTKELEKKLLTKKTKIEYLIISVRPYKEC